MPSHASDSRNNNTIRSYSEHLTLRGYATLVLWWKEAKYLISLHSNYFDDAGINLQFRRFISTFIKLACYNSTIHKTAPEGVVWERRSQSMCLSTPHRCRSIFTPLCFLTRSEEEIEVMLNQRQRWQLSESCDLQSTLFRLKGTQCLLSDILTAFNKNIRRHFFKYRK